MNFLLGRRIFSRYVSLKEGNYQDEILDKSLFRVHLFLRLWPKNIEKLYTALANNDHGEGTWRRPFVWNNDGFVVYLLIRRICQGRLVSLWNPLASVISNWFLRPFCREIWHDWILCESVLSKFLIAPKTHQQRHHSQRRFFLLNPCGDDVGLAQFFEPWKRRAIYAHALQAQQKGLVIHHHSRKTGIIFIQYTATLEDIYIGTNQRCIAPIWTTLHPLKINCWNIIPWRFCADHFPFLSWVEQL